MSDLSKFEVSNTIVIICNGWTLDELLPILKYLKLCGDIGHSVEFKIDDRKFFFDGDGASKINDLIVNGHSETQARLEKLLHEEQSKNVSNQLTCCCESENVKPSETAIQ